MDVRKFEYISYLNLKFVDIYLNEYLKTMILIVFLTI